MLEKTFQPAEIEPRIDSEWEKAQAFKAGRLERLFKHQRVVAHQPGLLDPGRKADLPRYASLGPCRLGLSFRKSVPRRPAGIVVGLASRCLLDDFRHIFRQPLLQDRTQQLRCGILDAAIVESIEATSGSLGSCGGSEPVAWRQRAIGGRRRLDRERLLRRECDIPLMR